MGNNSKKERKASEKKENEKKANKSVRKILSIIKEYKEAFVLLCTAFGLAVSSFWNISCDVIYRGYADCFHIDISYIARDNQGLFVSLLIILGTATVCLPFFILIYQLELKYHKRPFCRLVPLGISFFVITIPFFLCSNFGKPIVLAAGQWGTVLFYLSVILCFLSAIFFTIYLLCLFYQLRRRKSKEKPKQETGTTDEQSQTDISTGKKANEQSITNKSKTSKSTPKLSQIIAFVKAIGFVLVVSLLMFVMGVYCLGRSIALSRTEFDFLELTTCDSIENNHKCALILSMTDDYFYLSKFTESESNEGSIITIYPDTYMVLQRTEEINPVSITRKRYDKMEIEKGTPAASP